jgi:hypothetical protein
MALTGSPFALNGPGIAEFRRFCKEVLLPRLVRDCRHRERMAQLSGRSKVGQHDLE